jgi:nitrogen regulatory protein P-II 1
MAANKLAASAVGALLALRQGCRHTGVTGRSSSDLPLVAPSVALLLGAYDAMMKIEAIIRPSSLSEVKKVLDHEWVAGITVSEVKGSGRPSRPHEAYRGVDYVNELDPRLKIDIVVPDPLVPRVLHDLERSLRSGRIDDGKIFTTRVGEAVRIRTGERGERAL